MKRKFLISITILVVILSVFLLTACNYQTGVDEELIVNGDFEDAPFATTSTTDKNPPRIIENWQKEYDKEFSNIKLTEKGSVSDGSEKTPLGDHSLKIQNDSKATACVYQTVNVDKRQAYKISYQVRMDSEIKQTGDYSCGAHISFKENVNTVLEEINYNTEGWKEVTLYVSPVDTDVLTICLKLGKEDGRAAGAVYFDNISMKRVENVPASATVHKISLQKISLSKPTQLGITFITLLSILSVAIMIVAYVLVRRIYGKRNGLEDFDATPIQAGDKKAKIKKIFLHPIAIASYLGIGALIMRLILLFTTQGFGTEMVRLINIARMTKTVPPQDMYAHLATKEFFEPGKMYLLHIFGGMGYALDDVGLSQFLRVPAIFADIAVVLTIYFYGRKYVGNKLSTIYAGLYALLPVVFVMSASKGAFESILIALLLISFITLIEKKYLISYLLLTLSVLFDIRAMALVPLAICYMVYMYYRADTTLKTFNIARAQIVFGFIAMFILYYALSVPFTIHYLNGQPLYIYSYYANIIIKNTDFSGNALNLYSMATMNNAKAVPNVAAIFNIIFLLILQIYVISLYVKNKNRLELLLLASFEVAVIAVFTLKIDYTYLFISLALLTIYTMISGEKRAFIILGGLSFLSFVNIGQIMNKSGFIGNKLSKMGGISSFFSEDPFLIIFSIFAVLLVLYYGYLTYSICNNDKKCDIPAMTKSFGVTVKEFFERLKKRMAKTQKE